MWSCAIPRPKVVQSVPCSALEYQLHLGWYKQKTSLLNSGILDSTCVPSREEEEDRGEGHSACEAYRPYINVMYYKYYVSGFGAHGCGSCLSNEQLTVICDNPQYFSYDLIWFSPWLLFIFKLPFFQSLIAHLWSTRKILLQFMCDYPPLAHAQSSMSNS